MKIAYLFPKNRMFLFQKRAVPFSEKGYAFFHLAVWKYTIGDTEYRKEVGNRRGLFHRNDTIAIKYLPESPVESYPIVYMGI